MTRPKGLVSLFLTFALISLSTPTWGAPPAPFPEKGDPVLVGRITQVDGELLRYIPEEQDWVATSKDAPFGLDDALYSGDGSRAEIIMPNNTWMRLDANSQVQMIALKEDVTEVDVASGVARFHNRSSQGIIKATTPFGFVTAKPGTVFDLYVGDQSAEVVSLKGRVDFIHDADKGRYEVMAGSSSIIADSRDVTSGDSTVDRDWDDWNEQRDQHWARRIEVKGDSARYVPEGLRYDSRDLDDHGRWEKVHYDGGYHQMWRPTGVSVGWTPYSVGRWTSYYGDQCWVPYEPFGYVTHHYGNWVLVGNIWYWAPPVHRPRVVVASPLSISFSWYPGRVGWIHRDAYVGWVPLAPREVYYGRRYWGPRTVVINQVNVYNQNIHIDRYRHIDRAVIVNQKDFYRVRDYRNVRITNVDRRTIINQYRGAHVVNNTVINNYNINRNRYDIDNVTVNRKPHQTAVQRITRNQEIARQRGNVNSRQIENNVSRARVKKAQFKETVPPPRVTSRLVDRDSVKKPESQVKFEQRELKKGRKPPKSVSEDQLGSMPQEPGKGSGERRGRDGRERIQRGSDQETQRPADRTGPRPPRGNRDIQRDTVPSDADNRGPGGSDQKAPRRDRQLRNLQDGSQESTTHDDRAARPRSPRERRDFKTEPDAAPPSLQGSPEDRPRGNRRERNVPQEQMRERNTGGAQENRLQSPRRPREELQEHTGERTGTGKDRVSPRPPRRGKETDPNEESINADTQKQRTERPARERDPQRWQQQRGQESRAPRERHPAVQPSQTRRDFTQQAGEDTVTGETARGRQAAGNPRERSTPRVRNTDMEARWQQQSAPAAPHAAQKSPQERPAHERIRGEAGERARGRQSEGSMNRPAIRPQEVAPQPRPAAVHGQDRDRRAGREGAVQRADRTSEDQGTPRRQRPPKERVQPQQVENGEQAGRRGASLASP